MADTTQDRDRGADGELSLPLDGYGSFEWWTAEVLAASTKRDQEFKPTWDRNVQSYLAKQVNQDGTTPNRQITVPKDFANVEQKKAQLFFQLPQIICKPMRPDLAATVPLAQAVLRFYLGPSRVDSIKMMGECLFDALCPAGIMASKIGYESIQDGITPIIIQAPNPQAGQPAPPAPALGDASMGDGATQAPGAVLGLNAPAQPETIPQVIAAPRIISERFFWERISPAKVLIPEGFTGSNYDLAPWLGFEFDDSAHSIKQRYGLTDDDITITTGSDDKRLRSERDPGSSSKTERVRGREIWLKAYLFDEHEKHPEKMRVLVFLDGMEKPVQYRDSPYQRFDAQTGRDPPRRNRRVDSSPRAGHEQSARHGTGESTPEPGQLSRERLHRSRHLRSVGVRTEPARARSARIPYRHRDANCAAERERADRGGAARDDGLLRQRLDEVVVAHSDFRR